MLGFAYPFASSQNAKIFGGLRIFFTIVRTFCESEFSLNVTVLDRPQKVRRSFCFAIRFSSDGQLKSVTSPVNQALFCLSTNRVHYELRVSIVSISDFSTLLRTSSVSDPNLWIPMCFVSFVLMGDYWGSNSETSFYIKASL